MRSHFPKKKLLPIFYRMIRIYEFICILYFNKNNSFVVSILIQGGGCHSIIFT